MQVVLSILQFFGWTLLIVLAVVLLVLLLVLFYPIRYLVDISWQDEKKVKFKIHWIFHMIRAKLLYGDELVYGEVWIFWKKITFSFDLTEKKEKEPKEKKVKEKKESSNEGIISKIKGMIERIKEIYPKLKKIWTDEKNKDAVRHLKKEFIYLIKVFLPKKSRIDVVFSTGSPDTTGQAFGVLACLPMIYQKKWKIIPDFESEEFYIKGTILGKGRIYICKIIGIIFRIVFDKNCQRLYTMINKLMKSIKKSNKAEGSIDG